MIDLIGQTPDVLRASVFSSNERHPESYGRWEFSFLNA
jgi:hypothetical protein